MTQVAAQPEFQIVHLADRLDQVPRVAAWGFAQWGHLSPGQTLETRQRDLWTELRRDALPMTFLAVDVAGEAVGTAALILDDLEGDRRNPWLASVFVVPAARRRGLAARLVRTIEQHASRLGYRRLFLFTASAAELYAGLGWQSAEIRPYRGEPVTIMQRELCR